MNAFPVNLIILNSFKEGQVRNCAIVLRSCDFYSYFWQDSFSDLIYSRQGTDSVRGWRGGGEGRIN